MPDGERPHERAAAREGVLPGEVAGGEVGEVVDGLRVGISGERVDD
jgi:hypothetical protein